MAIGWKQITGQWYYFNSNGSMAKGWKQLGGYWYYFDDNGVMLSNTIVDGYKLAESGEWVY